MENSHDSKTAEPYSHEVPSFESLMEKYSYSQGLSIGILNIFLVYNDGRLGCLAECENQNDEEILISIAQEYELSVLKELETFILIAKPENMKVYMENKEKKYNPTDNLGAILGYPCKLPDYMIKEDRYHIQFHVNYKGVEYTVFGYMCRPNKTFTMINIMIAVDNDVKRLQKAFPYGRITSSIKTIKMK